jgi:hypothetical protein
MCLFWFSLTVVTLCVECYCDTRSWWQPFFSKGFGYFAKVLSFSTKIPGVIQLFVAVHLIGYGSVTNLCSVFYLSLNPWEATGWQVIAIDADVKQVKLQTFDNSVFTLGYKPWWHCGANAEMVVVITLRSQQIQLRTQGRENGVWEW